jgi:HAMP domain-containing protein
MPRQRRRRHTAPGPTDLALSEPVQRLAGLRRERDRVLKEIGSKRRELERAVAKIEAARGEVTARMTPVMDQHQAVEEELHALFVELLAPGRLAKRKQRTVREIYLELHETGLIGPPRVEIPKPRRAADGFFDDMFGKDAWEDSSFHGRAHAGPRSGGYSANKPGAESKHQSLRSLFKRLVVALHPDRTQQEDERTRRTEAMKEVTQAYETGDLARLIELEAHWAAGTLTPEAPDDARRAVQALERTVAELKRQLRDVLDGLRETRRSEAYKLMKDLERQKKAGGDALAEAFEEARARLDEVCKVRDFVAAFRAGKLTWDQFVAGPEPSSGDELDDEALMRELLGMLRADIGGGRPAGKRRRTRRQTIDDEIPF